MMEIPKFHRVRPSTRLVMMAAVAVLLAGCDRVRDKVEDVFAAETPYQVLDAADFLIRQGRYVEAKDKAQRMADNHDSPMRGEFALATSRASALKGDTADALHYLALALQIQVFSTSKVINEPAFHNLQTNVPFLEIITQNASHSAETPPLDSTLMIEADTTDGVIHWAN